MLAIVQALKRFCACQECLQNSTLFAQFLLSFITYVLLSYFVCLHCANIHIPLPSFSSLMTLQTSNKALDQTRCYSKCSKRYWSKQTTRRPHHTLDQDPHPSPNTPNLEDSLLDLQDQPADVPYNPLPPQSNLWPVQACSDRRSQQRLIPALTRTLAPDL